MKQLLPLLLLSSVFITKASAQKTTATGSRMMANSYYKHDGAKFVASDSSRYAYSGDRGGDALNTPKADTSTNRVYNNATMSWDNKTLLLETFDAKSNILSYVTRSWDNATSAWKNSGGMYFTYISVAGKDLTETQTVQSWDNVASAWKNTAKYRSLYNADGEIDTMFLQAWDAPSSAWKNSKMAEYVYNASDKTLTEIIEYNWNSGTSKWDKYRRNFHQYDANLNMVFKTQENWNAGPSTWTYVKRDLYTYDASKNKKTHTLQIWNAGTSAWDNSDKELFTYNASNVMISQTQQFWDVVTSSHVNSSKTEYTLDAGNNITMELYSLWDKPSTSWKQYLRTQYAYNSYSQRTSDIRDRWNAGGFWEYTINDYKRNYYYEEYTLGVKEVATASVGNLNVYPNPAGNVVNINMQWAKPQAFEVLITNNMGQLVYRIAEHAQTSYVRSIPVSELQNGVYYVVLKGETDKITKTILIQK